MSDKLFIKNSVKQLQKAVKEISDTDLNELIKNGYDKAYPNEVDRQLYIMLSQERTRRTIEKEKTI